MNYYTLVRRASLQSNSIHSLGINARDGRAYPGLSAFSLGHTPQVAVNIHGDSPKELDFLRAICVPLVSIGVRTVNCKSSAAVSLERVSFGGPVPFGFDDVQAGEQIRRLLVVNLHALRQPLLSGSRYRLLLPVILNGVAYELPIDNVSEVSVILRHMAHLPIRPVSLAVSRRRAGELMGQSWLAGVA